MIVEKIKKPQQNVSTPCCHVTIYSCAFVLYYTNLEFLLSEDLYQNACNWSKHHVIEEKFFPISVEESLSLAFQTFF